MRFWLLCWVVLAAFWLLLVDTVTEPEVYAGAVAAALGASFMAAMRAQRIVAFRPRLRWLRPAPLVLVRAVADVGLLASALFRRLVLRREVRGEFRAVPFRHGGNGGGGAGRGRLAEALRAL